jgi:hypothetical protein
MAVARSVLSRRLQLERSVGRTSDEMSVLFARQREASSQAVVLGTQAVGFGLFPILLLTMGESMEPMLWLIGIPCCVVAMTAIVLSAWHVLGEERIEVEGGYLAVSRSIGPLARRWLRPLASVQDVQVLEPNPSARLNDTWGFGQPRVKVIGPDWTLRLALAAAPDAAQALAKELRAAVAGARA